MSATKIQWTERTLNAVTGCDRVSDGCKNCYALTLAKRLKGMGSAKYQNDGDPKTSGPGFALTMHPDVLFEPLRWRKPQMVFTNSMSDMFHKHVTDEFIARMWVIMALTPQHTYQVLTKRHARMRSVLSSPRWADLLPDALRWVLDNAAGPIAPDRVDAVHAWTTSRELAQEWQPPLDNVWLGMSVENQQWANIRIPALLDTPAVVRWLSLEPLLGSVDLQAADPNALVDGGLDWLVVGGESGKGARPLDTSWVRSLIEQGHRHPAGRVFVKQLGACWARDTTWGGKPVASVDSHGGEPGYWPSDLRVREFPATVLPSGGTA